MKPKQVSTARRTADGAITSVFSFDDPTLLVAAVGSPEGPFPVTAVVVTLEYAGDPHAVLSGFNDFSDVGDVDQSRESEVLAAISETIRRASVATSDAESEAPVPGEAPIPEVEQVPPPLEVESAPAPPIQPPGKWSYRIV